jgi:hypothetical protein
MRRAPESHTAAQNRRGRVCDGSRSYGRSKVPRHKGHRHMTAGEAGAPMGPSLAPLAGRGRGEGPIANMTVAPAELTLPATPTRRGGFRAYIRRHPTIVIGATLLGLMALMMAISACLTAAFNPGKNKQGRPPIRKTINESGEWQISGDRDSPESAGSSWR